jgi:hypothetical protein
MACNCKQIVTNWTGGDVPNPTTFLNCGEADGTYKNPIPAGEVQCIAPNNVLQVHNTWEINGTLNNSGMVYFTREYTFDPGSGLQPIILLEI